MLAKEETMDRVIEKKGTSLAKVVPIEEAHPQSTPISSRQCALLDELHSLPALEIAQDPVAVLRTIRKQK